MPRELSPRTREILIEAARRGIKLPKHYVRRILGQQSDGKFLSFRDYVALVKPRFKWFKHNQEAGGVLQRVADGELNRVLFFWPPRHGKTEQISRLFSAYYLYRHPERFVGLCSYAAALAHNLSLEAQNNFVAGGGRVHPRSSARDYWLTTRGGGMWASGVGGPITGRGFHLGIIDDPLKNAEEAASKTITEKQIDWWQSTFYTRGEPGEQIIVIMTRWSEKDLAGFLLQDERDAISEDEDGITENWYIVNWQAIRDMDDPPDFPASCTLHPDWRKHGEALCPERYWIERLQRIKKRIGTYFFNALFQQKPTPKGGTILRPEWFARLNIELVPPMTVKIAGADLAFTAKTSADWTVLFPMGRDANGRFYLFRPYRAQVEAPYAIQGMSDRCREEKVQILGIEDAFGQAAYIQIMREKPEMQGTAIVPIPADKDKESRARGWAPIAEQGLITLVTDGTGWEQVFLKEAGDFPRGSNDDQVDGAGMCFELMRMVAAGGTPVGGVSTRNRDMKEGLRGTKPRRS